MSVTTMMTSRAPWETAFSATATATAPDSPAVRAVPVAIPVVGAPIRGRHLVRAPWTEPLSAFAGVIVGTQQVPDEWFRPRSASRRVMDPPAIAIRETAGRRPLVAIPIVTEAAVARTPAAASVPTGTTIPVRVVPAIVPPAAEPADPTTPILSARSAQAKPEPVAPGAPSAPPTLAGPARIAVVPPAGRRGMLGRAVTLTVGLVISLVAFEAASRLGRR